MWTIKKKEFKQIGGYMRVFAKSDVGKAREINEDYFWISSPEDEIKLYILADGMGGYNRRRSCK